MNGVVILQLVLRPEEVKSKVVVMAQTRHYEVFHHRKAFRVQIHRKLN